MFEVETTMGLDSFAYKKCKVQKRTRSGHQYPPSQPGTKNRQQKEKKKKKKNGEKKNARPRPALWQMLGEDVLRLIFSHLSATMCAHLRQLDRNTHHVAKKALRQHLGLSDSQWYAFRAAVDRRTSVFITGPPGTGKTHLIRKIAACLKESHVLLCASTGAAAESIGGQSLHSAFCLGKDSTNINLDLAISQCRTRRETRLLYARTIVIDDVSTLTSYVLDAVLTIADAVCVHRGVQFVLGGDPLQLGEIYRATSIPRQRRPFWNALLLLRVTQPHVLVEHFRQDGDSHFARVLNRARVGKASEADLRWLLESSCQPKPAEATFLEEPLIERVHRRWREDYNPQTLCLFCTRSTAFQFNDHSMKTLPGVEQLYRTPFSWGSNDGMDPSQYLKLKVGARVMLTRKPPFCNELFNGSVGTVMSMTDCTTRVNFDHGGPHIICRLPTRNGQGLQLPLKVAWAETVHGVQGATLDHARVDLSFCFGKAQAYVALSRVRRVKDLEIVSLTLSKLNNVDKDALRWYNKIKDACEERVVAFQDAEAARFVVV
jgi:hypothetical protein